MFDYSKLLGRIKEVCGSQAVFSIAMKLSERTISLKLSNQREWKQSEIKQACSILKIQDKEIPQYFFIPRVQKNEQK